MYFKNKPKAFIVASVCLISLVGFTFFNTFGSDKKVVVGTVDTLPQVLAVEEKVLEDKTSHVVTLKKLIKTKNKTENERAEIEPITPHDKLMSTLSALKDQINKTGKVLQHPMVSLAHDTSQLRYDLLKAVEENPELTADLLASFKEAPNSLLSREISDVLSEIGTAEVQTAVLDIGLDPYSSSHEERAAALMVVANMEEISPDTRDRLLDSYSYEDDSEIMQYSLMALHESVSTIEDRERVISVLDVTIDRDDENVRRHAAYQLGEWAATNDDLQPLRTMAVQEVDINARARAVSSIAESAIQSDENKAVLFEIVSNTEEWAPIREVALRSLQDYKNLTSNDVYDLDSLSVNIEEAVEALQDE